MNKIISIHPFKHEYASNFKSLNLEWIEEFFIVEQEDIKILSNPEEYVLAKGGEIFFAKQNGEIIGTSAMIRSGPKTFELAKMAVTKSNQGNGVGKMLMGACLKFAREQEAEQVFLVTNNILEPALELYKSSGFMIDLNYDDQRYKRGNTKLILQLNCLSGDL